MFIEGSWSRFYVLPNHANRGSRDSEERNMSSVVSYKHFASNEAKSPDAVLPDSVVIC